MSSQTKYQNKKWTFFISHPVGLLQRQIRANVYWGLELSTNLKVSKLLVINEQGRVYTFFSKAEDKRNDKLVRNDYEKKRVEQYFKKFKNIIKRVKFSNANPFEQSIVLHFKIGPILVYSHYLERVLTEKARIISNLSKKEKERLKGLIRQNNFFRDNILKKIDTVFEKAHQYLVRKHPKIKDLDYYLMDEIKNSRQVNQQELTKRKAFCVLILQKNKSRLFTGIKARKFLKKIGFTIEKTNQLKELKGFVAVRGKVLGKVTIIKSLNDFKKKGVKQIVVSPMTAPSFTPYLKRAKAIITNEGGVNCHAAICAREFKIPCIVGTKIATQVFKNGDLVEVDANKGVVRKIK